jgi:uncharacterized protein YdhG (YjbR/CyaY superfamily)
MVMSKAKTVQEYLDELPEERRAVVEAVRKVILRHLPKGYREAIGYGMINYEVPLERLPTTYNGKPLCYAGLAAQKNHFAVYLMVACDDKVSKQLRAAFEKAGKKLDMGKGCVRFKKLEDIPLDAIGKAIAACPLDKFVAIYEASRKK